MNKLFEKLLGKRETTGQGPYKHKFVPIDSYTEAFEISKRTPFAIEKIQHLIDFGIPIADVKKIAFACMAAGASDLTPFVEKYIKDNTPLISFEFDI